MAPPRGTRLDLVILVDLQQLTPVTVVTKRYKDIQGSAVLASLERLAEAGYVRRFEMANRDSVIRSELGDKVARKLQTADEAA